MPAMGSDVTVIGNRRNTDWQWKNVGDKCLIVFLKTKLVGALAEASPAYVQSVLANNTTGLLANSAPSFEGSFCILSGMFRHKVNWHLEQRPAITAETVRPSKWKSMLNAL
jgi:hypothetical protein